MNYMKRWDCQWCGGKVYVTPGTRHHHCCTTENNGEWVIRNIVILGTTVGTNIIASVKQTPRGTWAWPDGAELTPGIEIRTNQKEDNMSRIDSLRRQAEYIMAEIERETEKLAKYGPEPKEGTILSFEYQFVPRGRWYTYAAIKAGGRWNTTGPKSPKAYTWEELITWFEDGKVRKLRRMEKGDKL